MSQFLHLTTPRGIPGRAVEFARQGRETGPIEVGLPQVLSMINDFGFGLRRRRPGPG
jgi:hypothetical protein